MAFFELTQPDGQKVYFNTETTGPAKPFNAEAKKRTYLEGVTSLERKLEGDNIQKKRIVDDPVLPTQEQEGDVRVFRSDADKERYHSLLRDWDNAGAEVDVGSNSYFVKETPKEVSEKANDAIRSTLAL